MREKCPSRKRNYILFLWPFPVREISTNEKFEYFLGKNCILQLDDLMLPVLVFFIRQIRILISAAIFSALTELKRYLKIRPSSFFFFIFFFFFFFLSFRPSSLRHCNGFLKTTWGDLNYWQNTYSLLRLKTLHLWHDLWLMTNLWHNTYLPLGLKTLHLWPMTHDWWNFTYDIWHITYLYLWLMTWQIVPECA